MAYTADDILTDAKLRAFYPTSGGVISDTDILRLGTDELLAIMTAQEMAGMQGNLAAEFSTPLTAGQQKYELPYRAAGSKLRYACLQDAQGTRINIRVGRPERFVTQYNITSQQNGTLPSNSWFEDGRLVLYPVPMDGTYSLVMGVYVRPGRLQLAAKASSASAAAIVGATTLSCAAIPSYMNGAVKVDIIRSTPPFNVIAFDLPVTALTTGATSITITAPGVPTYPVFKNDWITLTEESVAPQAPAETHPLLAARVAKRILQARGDREMMAAVSADIQEMQSNLYTYLSNRNEGQIDTMADNGLLSSTGKSRFGFGLGGF